MKTKLTCLLAICLLHMPLYSCAQILWEYLLEDEGNVWVIDMVEVENGNTLAIGNWSDNNFNLRVFVTKLDLAGNVIWEQILDEQYGEFALNVVPTEDGYLLNTGAEAFDFFSLVFKMTTDGELLWSQSVFFIEQTERKSMVTDSEGNIYLNGNAVSPSTCFCPTVVKLDADEQAFNQWVYGSAEFDTYRSQQLFITADDQLIMTNSAQAGPEYFQWILAINTDGTVENQHSIQVYNSNLERRVLSELYNDQEILLSGVNNQEGISSLIRYNLATEEIKTSFENPISADEDHTIFLLNDGRIGLIYDPGSGSDYDFLRILVREPDGTTCYIQDVDFYSSPETEVVFQQGNGQIYMGGLTRDWMQSFDYVFSIDDQTCGTVSTQEHTVSRLVELAPNPSSISFRAVFSEPIPRTLYLYNQQGQVLFQGQTQNTQVEIPTVDLPNGTYLLQVHEESGVVYTEKVAVLH